MTIEEANLNDLPALSRLRAEHWGTANEWEPRITAYMIQQQTPPYGLQPRAVYVAVEDNEVVGLIAGHLTTRFSCQGEINWLNVAGSHRGRRIADALIRKMAEWFAARNALKVCVTVAPSNNAARVAYGRHGATEMGPQWLVFENISTAIK